MSMTEDTRGERDALAPVIPLFGARPVAPEPDAPAPEWHPTWLSSDGGEPPAEESEPPGDADALERAERMLLRKLRTRSLSLREARAALSGEELEPAASEALLERFVALGYLDDRALAEQLVDKALSRKAQGRQAVAQVLTQRGIPREVADEVLAELPGDEAERALAFARSKAPALADLDRDTALRRLAGQLARRGFGAVALSAARTALEERTAPTGRGVRFD